MGLLPERVETRLPGWRVVCTVRYASGEHSVTLPLLDTVRFDLHRRQASLVWRANFRRDDAILEIMLGVTNRPIVGGTVAAEAPL